MTLAAAAAAYECPWLPARFTPPLSEDFVTDGDRLIAAVEQFWTLPDGRRLVLDEWQKWLLRRVLERYPADWPVAPLRGRLRYRQVVISMGRQNGKSVLGAILGFYGLAMHDPGPEVIGLASTTEQANIVYDRVLHVIRSHQLLSKRFKATGTRGITARNGAGSYKVKAAKGEALQGIPVSVCLFDELHISKPEMWAAVVNGQRTRRNALLVGITTAGDDDSELLKMLYKTGEEAIAGQHERFGFFCWEATEGATIETPGAIEAANPTIAENPYGREDGTGPDLETVRSDVRLLPEPDQIRYVLNRFTSSSSAWIPLGAWQNRAETLLEADGAAVFYTFERTASWEHAAIVATMKLEDGRIWTELVASVVAPTLEQLVTIAEQLRSSARGSSSVFAMDGLRLGALGRILTEKGFDVRQLRLGDQLQAGPSAYSLIVAGRVSHAGDPLLTHQNRKARRKNVGEGWRISAADSSGDVDAVLATVAGIYLADSTNDPGIQMW